MDDEKIINEALKYDEELNGHPCETCGLACGCDSGGKGKECIACIYCNPDQTK